MKLKNGDLVQLNKKGIAALAGDRVIVYIRADEWRDIFKQNSFEYIKDMDDYTTECFGLTYCKIMNITNRQDTYIFVKDWLKLGESAPYTTNKLGDFPKREA